MNPEIVNYQADTNPHLTNTMSDRRPFEFEPNSIKTLDSTKSNNTPPLPYASMGESAYIRIHANASPSKLRDIVKKHIFPNDDVDYLKRLVGDVGIEYVFHFLWYDCPKPTSYFDEWDEASFKSFPLRSGHVDGWNESPTRGESNWGSATYNTRKAASAAEKSRGGSAKESEKEAVRAKDTKRSGRSWIQYCCANNAHKCLRWIFRKIVTIRLKIVNEELERQMVTNGEHRCSLTRQSNSRKLHKEGYMMYVIKEMLEYPSRCYCATNYVAVAALTGSQDCLHLLLQYGGLDPNMRINRHGSTAAHIAAWKDNVECMQVLQSGCYSCEFSTKDDLDGSTCEEIIPDCSCSDESDHIMKNDDPDTFMPFTEVPCSRIETWIANWNIRNEQGETPMHVAAKEGSCRVMQFFLDLAISFAEAEVMRESYQDDSVSRRPQCLSEDGAKVINQHIMDESIHSSSPLVDFSLRTNDGMDCAALASQNNHANVIEILANSIRHLKEIHDDRCQDIKQSASDGVWHNPLSHLGAQNFIVTKPLPQSHLPSLRRRANTDPARFHMVHKTPIPSLSEHNSNKKLSLPLYYPSFNLHNPQEKNNHETPIHIASRQGNIDVIRALFDSGCCDTAARDSLGQTALHIAVLANRFEVVQFFSQLNIEYFRKFDVVDILGKTPLYTACNIGNASIVRILTPISNWRVVCHEKKQSPDTPLLLNVASQPPLHAAVVNNFVDTVSVLLDCGVNVDQHDVNGRTAINAAAKLGYYEMCQTLILHGADVNARSSRGGPTPFQKAKKYKHPDVADLLYEFGGR